ncbi:hypothetical protein QW131_28470 [Roseibium salinum]|nr:hypothetical protein [Roseibium salinum]
MPGRKSGAADGFGSRRHDPGGTGLHPAGGPQRAGKHECRLSAAQALLRLLRERNRRCRQVRAPKGDRNAHGAVRAFLAHVVCRQRRASLRGQKGAGEKGARHNQAETECAVRS